MVSPPLSESGAGADAPGVGPADHPEFRAWLRERVAAGQDRFTAGYQGQIHLYRGPGGPLAVKTVGGRAPVIWMRRAILRREYRVYRHLRGFDAVPRCLGLIDGRYLVLEYVDGPPYRHARLDDREAFFGRLLDAIRAMHDRGVAHGDLKKKDNILVVDGRPLFVDFGTAIVRGAGFRPLNRWLFRLLAQWDLNTWAKLKSDGRRERLTDAEAALWQRTWIERAAAAVKRAYTRVRWPGGKPVRQHRPPGDD